MMKTPGAILLLAVLLGSYEALPVEGDNVPEHKPHPGTCPKILAACKLPLPSPQCRSDTECLKTDKCCNLCGKKCVPAVRDEPHPGTCPKILAACKLPLPSPQCRSDTECLKTDKCCNLCGKKCVPAVREKSGVCPTVKFTCMMIPLPRTCHHDTDCVGVQKCCQHSCGFGCTAPVTDSSTPA
ncbi:WAP four-disulfide core domain protein 5-like [Pleurodeles waltl]|uniref:WAP four-disulfide core domain protein 5-like n=1 Tax=Pleurodeles waltl TaxID=8319 RepID=UPI0037098058